MRYEKRNKSGETKSIWPPRDTINKDGISEHDIGLQIYFTGKPPICDTEIYAKRRAEWEQQLGKITQGSERALEARIKELDKIICRYLDDYDEYKAGLIFPAKTRKQRLTEQGLLVCAYCPDEEHVFVGDTIETLMKHQFENHAEELAKQMQSTNSGDVNEQRADSKQSTEALR